MALLTTAEKTGFRATSTHAEVMAFIAGLGSSPYLHVTSIGTSPGGRDLPLLILSADGVKDAQSARALGRPVVLLQNCIHAGEVEGKEAALMLVRDLLNGAHQDLLKSLTLLVLPVFNPDGNDAMDTSNRALQIEALRGQDGPPKVGTRTNAKGINLNRDYLKHEALEMQLLQTRLNHVWQPDLTVDTHATNGSVHRFSMTYDIPHTTESGRREPIEYMRSVMTPEISALVKREFGFDSGWYGNFVEDERALDTQTLANPTAPVREGWMTYPHHPRFGSNYRGLTNRLDLLLECYSYLSFEERVRVTYAWLLSTLQIAAQRASEIVTLIQSSRTPPERIAIRYDLRAFPNPFEVLTREPRTRTGASTSVTIPHLARFVGTCVVDRPRGYVVPGRLAPFLRGHGLSFESAPTEAVVSIGRLAGYDVAGGRNILEASGHGIRAVEWSKPSAQAVPEGALFVPSDQPLGAVAVYLCEPESDDGLVENGLSPNPALGEAFEIWRLLE